MKTDHKPGQRQYQFWFSWCVLIIKVANELWYSTSKNGERNTYLFHVGVATRPKTHPHARIFSVTLLWFVFQVGYRHE